MNSTTRQTILVSGALVAIPTFLAPLLAGAAAGGETLATVNGTAITEADIQPKIEGQMLRINNQVYTLKKRAVDAAVANILLDQEAKKRGISRQQLLQQEVNAKVKPVTDEEVATFYEKNKARFGKKPLDEVTPQIKPALAGRQIQARRQAYLGELRKAATVAMLFQPPLVEVSVDGAPIKGPADAPITLVEFSDYQ